MESAKILREKIQNETVTTGALLTFHLWPGIVEIARNAGLDFIIVDTEHMRFDDELVADVCAMGRLLNYPVLIRPPETEPGFVRLAADKGACGLFLPMVNDVATMDAVRDGLYMPPRGKRRPGGPGNRWVSTLQYMSWRTEVADDFIVLPQIESPKGVENADASAAHPLTTAFAPGPYDLSANLGVCWQPQHPDLLNALERIRQAGGKPAKTCSWSVTARRCANAASPSSVSPNR